MLNSVIDRVIEYGETATGRPVPENREDLIESLKADRYLESCVASKLIETAKLDRQQWFIDVAKCGVSDLVGRALHGKPRYGMSQYAKNNTITVNGKR